MKREAQIQRAQTEHFDVAIIGGGITGAGILMNAVQQGLKAVLIEKNDFASGTSSRSSKMIHGGLRYMQYMQFGLIKEALQERGHLLKKFPHLVKPVGYVFPHHGSKLGLWVKNIGLTLYDTMAADAEFPKHVLLNKAQTLNEINGYTTDKLAGSILYYDCGTNDARLTVDTIAECIHYGAVAINYVKAIKAEGDDTITTLHCNDELSGSSFSIQAKVYINATGIWTDETLQQVAGIPSQRMMPTKGIHVVVSADKLPANRVAIVKVPGEKRYIYNLPWENNLSILGTTDTTYNGSNDEVLTTEADVQYILDAFNHCFPNLKLTYAEVISVYAGLRPLLNDEGKDNSSRSREYETWWSKTNWLNIAGGKLTSFLNMGKRCLQVVHQKFPDLMANAPEKETWHGTGKWAKEYGEFGLLIEAIEHEKPEHTQRFSAAYNYTIAEFLFFIRYQFAQQVADLLTRRTSVTYAMRNYDASLVKQVAELMARELQKDAAWIEAACNSYYQHWQEYHPAFLTSTPKS